MTKNELKKIGEYALAGLYEEPKRSLFYKKALGIRRFYENCKLQPYLGAPLYPSGERVYDATVRPWYLLGLNCDSANFEKKSPTLYKKVQKTFVRRWSFVPPEHTVGGNMFTHSLPHYERILREGLLSYQDRINNIKDDDLREGLLHLIEGIKTYLYRCVDYLVSVSAEPKLIEALKRVPLYPARNIYEAIVSWNFILYLDECDNLGCLAKGLAPYYKGEDILPLLINLFDNIDKNEGYSMALDNSTPELTVLCLRASYGKRRPMIELFVDENTPEEIWNEAFRSIKSGSGGPAFYNKKILFNGLKKRFPSIKDEDLEMFCGGGCTESMISGHSNVGSLDAGINLLLILESVMKTRLTSANSFEEFYNLYIDEVKAVISSVKKEINRARRLRAKYNPLPMRTLLIDDCIDKGVEYNAGGARYNWSVINFAGLINVIDSLLTIKNMVFDKKELSASEILALLEKNDQEFLKRVKQNGLCFGTDKKEVNEFAHKFSKTIFALTKRGKLVFGEGFLSSSIQFNSQALAGKNVGATPDGRENGAPLCDSLGAIFGKDALGPTALLNSVTSLDLKNALGVPVLNFNISNDFSEEVFKSLILGYMKKGGIQMQITHATKEELLDAYAHPENHNNLIVRVGGYSEYFNRLPNDLKLMVINRTVQNAK